MAPTLPQFKLFLSPGLDAKSLAGTDQTCPPLPSSYLVFEFRDTTQMVRK